LKSGKLILTKILLNYKKLTKDAEPWPMGNILCILARFPVKKLQF